VRTVFVKAPMFDCVSPPKKLGLFALSTPVAYIPVVLRVVADGAADAGAADAGAADAGAADAGAADDEAADAAAAYSPL